MIKVLIADDDIIVREGLKMIISSQDDMETAGEAENGKAALDLARKARPDIALLDIRMPAAGGINDGITAAEKMLAERLCAPLLLTTFDEEDFILRALKSEICGYILKNSPAERIIGAIRVVNAGGTVFQEDILKYVRGKISSASTGEIFKELTPRELEVVRLIAEGLSNRQIAERLFLSDGTVRNHISSILEKTGLEHRTQIAVMWLRK